MKVLKYKGFVVYLGTTAFGWLMYGVGYKALWYFGLSIAREA